MKVKELLSNPKNWIQCSFANNKEGKPTKPDAADACSWCLIGAVWKCYNGPDRLVIGDNKYIEILNKIANKIGVEVPTNEKLQKVFNIVSEYNDSHSYEEVIKIVNELDI